MNASTAGADGVARIELFFGAPGTGKSFAMKQRIETVRPRRLFIFDPQGEYHAYGTPTSSLTSAAAISSTPAFGVVFQPSDELTIAEKQFSVFCRLAYERGRCVFVVDELADVTKPGWAPVGWRTLTRKGRHQEVHILAASQRPTEIDARARSLATSIRTGRLNAKGDLDALAGILLVSADELARLPPRRYCQRDMTTGAVVFG